MATTEASPDIDTHDDHDHGHDHDHPAWLAHHFDTPQQQYDSGKLGIWIFLVTEVLFFSGMFCAYAIFRMLNPDVFEGCSQFLNTKLGAINTGVLLFSSLTMAWAVRCSQTEEHKGLTALLASTLSCAMIFLGVKAIEYSHKWGLGLLPAGLFTYDPANTHHIGPSIWDVLCPPGRLVYNAMQNARMVDDPTFIADPGFLAWLCLPFWFALVGVLIWLVTSFITDRKFQFEVAKPLSVVCLCFFVGVGLGLVLESGESDAHASDHSGEHIAAEHGGDAHADGGVHAADAQASDAHSTVEHDGDEAVAIDDLSIEERLATDETNTGIRSELNARQRQAAVAGGAIVYDSDDVAGGISSVEENVLTPSRAGVFFSIYYCMTGVHAIHILGGIAVMVWLLVRSVRRDFNRQYFGPVDYVGLYWHLVDLIWIYLFPLMYLIR
jgi:cytochrome c oxidase subunit 3